MKTILVTGGAGYIGSHTCVELLEQGYEVVVIDSLINAQKDSLDRVREITGKTVTFVEGDLRDQALVEKVLRDNKVDCVIHIAGLKAVGESVSDSLLYYDNNIAGTLALLKAMNAANVKSMVFSSSATVYGNPSKVPITEDFPLQPESPYGQTKFMIEQILKDLHRSQPEWKIVLLRYFNPVGAHASGKIGENPNGRPNNLFPFITQVIVGKLPHLTIFGNDYSTPDGTGVRDYIHITDLAKGHIAAMKEIAGQSGCCEIYNLGTGKGYSVLEIVDGLKKACGKDIPFEIKARRPGDVPILQSDPSKAEKELNWKATLDLQAMCDDAWRWQKQNPNGFLPAK